MTISDLSIFASSLPKEHPICVWKKVLGQFPKDDSHPRPPFVIHTRKERTRQVIIPTSDGTRPTSPTTVNLKLRPWNDKGTLAFWTVDLNGDRYIVSPFTAKLQRYRIWQDSDLFDSRVVLLSTHHRKGAGSNSTQVSPSGEVDRTVTTASTYGLRGHRNQKFAKHQKMDGEGKDHRDRGIGIEESRVIDLKSTATAPGPRYPEYHPTYNRQEWRISPTSSPSVNALRQSADTHAVLAAANRPKADKRPKINVNLILNDGVGGITNYVWDKYSIETDNIFPMIENMAGLPKSLVKHTTVILRDNLWEQESIEILKDSDESLFNSTVSRIASRADAEMRRMDVYVRATGGWTEWVEDYRLALVHVLQLMLLN